MKRIYKLIFFFLLLSLLTIPGLYIVKQLISFDISTIKANDRSVLLNQKNTSAHSLKFIENTIPKDKTILVFEQSMFAYYLKNHFISFLDPDMVELFKLTSDLKIQQFLKKKNISYIYIPHYADPSIFNTAFGQFISKPEYMTLLYQSGFSRIYKVLTQSKKIDYIKISFPDIWTTVDNKGRPVSVPYTNQAANEFKLVNSFNKFNNHQTTALLSGKGGKHSGQSENKILISENVNLNYFLQLELRGLGYYHVELLEYDNHHKFFNSYELWQGVLKNKILNNVIQFNVSHEATSFRVNVSLEGPGQLEIINSDLYHFETLDISRDQNINFPVKTKDHATNNNIWGVCEKKDGLLNLLNIFLKKKYSLINPSGLLFQEENGVSFTPNLPKKQILCLKEQSIKQNTGYQFEFFLDIDCEVSVTNIFKNYYGQMMVSKPTSIFVSKMKKIKYTISPDMIPTQIGIFPVSSLSFGVDVSKCLSKTNAIRATDFKVSLLNT